MSDLRLAFRSLLKSPGFTAVALLTLALGIGVNTSMFTVVNTLLLQQVPFNAPDRLMRVFRTAPQSQNWPHANANFLDLKTQNHVFSSMAAYRGASFNYSIPGQPAERLRGMYVTGEFFSLLGINPSLGRAFTSDEARPGGPEVVVLSHECWVNRFASDPSIIGRQVRVDSTLSTIVGVMPADFVPPLLWGPIDIWRPLVFSARDEQNRENNYLSAIGRLAPDVSPAQAETELRGIASRLATEHPLTNAGSSVRLVPLARSGQDNATRYTSWFVMGLAGFVLLIACANLANLQFSRSAGRAREHAIRLALGASRWRVMRVLLAESALLGIAGGLLGLLLAMWCNDFLGRQLVMGPTIGIELPLDLRVFGFALGIASFSVFASGLLPAWFAARSNVGDTLKLGSRGVVGGRAHHRLRHGLIVAEVALALMLLAGAGVFIRGLQRFATRDPGWRPDNMLTGTISLPTSKYSDDASRRAFFIKLDESLAANSLIQHAALASSLPIREYSSSTSYAVEGRPAPKPGDEPLANLTFVNPGFLETIGLRLLQGRFFNADDRDGKPQVVVINEAMARTLFPGENPVGRRIGDPDTANPSWWEIVGVVSDVGAPASLTSPDTRFQTYRPIAQQSFNFATIAVRGRVAPEQLTSELRRIVTAIDPDQPVHSVITARGEIDRALANFHVISRLLGGFALLGLALAAIGIYGVLANFVLQRTQEIGVRLALGAQLRDVLRLVLGHGLRLSLFGAAIGIVGAFALARVLSSMMPALGAPEPLLLAAVVVSLLAVAFLACWLPARRATRVDPIVALRAE